MKKAFPLVDLLIVLATLGVSGVIVIVIVIVVGGCGAKLLGAKGIERSDGSRTGLNYKLSKKGVIWKTYEGELSLQVTTRDSEGGLVNQVFNYSVSDPAVAKEIETRSSGGKPITLHYKEYLLRGYKYGSTGYDITKVSGGVEPRAEQ